MASLSQKTKTRRKLTLKKMGKERKRRIRKEGSTPPFAVHPKK